MQNGVLILDYWWSEAVSDHLVFGSASGIPFRVISPEDIVVLKGANPRGDEEIAQIKTLFEQGLVDREYLELRLQECKASEEVVTFLNSV